MGAPRRAGLRRRVLRLLRLDAEWLAGGEEELLLDEVEARHELRHRMLDLEARVQLQKEEAIAGEHELGGSGVLVAHRARERDRRRRPLRLEARVESGGGALLENLLVAALNRAFALAQMDDAAVPVGQNLDLDVPRPVDVLLGEDAAVAESRLRLACRRLESRLQLLGRTDDPHSPPAAPRRGLDHERVAELLGLPGLDHRHTCLPRAPLGFELVARGSHRSRRWANEDEPGSDDGLREVGVLGQEAVAGVDSVGAAFRAALISSAGSR